MLLGATANLTLYTISRFDVGLQGHLSLKEWDTGQTHDLIYFGLLPPIIFEAGFHMNNMQFFNNLGAISGYALLGTVLAILATGAMVWLLGLPGGPLWTQYTVVQALVFGALISSTDPVATLGILKSVRATPLLYQLIFGESALNDALSIVLFHVFLKAAVPPDGEPAPHMDPTKLFGVFVDVLRVCAGSVCLGIIWALASAALSRKLRAAGPADTHPHASFELAMLLLFALLSYTTAEECGFSGVMSLFVSALVMRHYTFHNLSLTSRRSAKALLTTLSETCETCLSVLLGIVFVDYLVVGIEHRTQHAQDGVTVWDLPFVALSVPILLVARAANILSCSFVANLGRRKEEQITPRMQLVMWFSGMRGPLSFALAVTLPGAQDAQHHQAGHAISEDARWTVPINTTTLAITLITNLLMAPLTGPLIALLNLRAEDAHPPRHGQAEAAEALTQPVAAADDGPGEGAPSAAGVGENSLTARLMESSGQSCAADGPSETAGTRAPRVAAKRQSACLKAWKLIDREYLKPIFGGRRAGEPADEAEEEEHE